MNETSSLLGCSSKGKKNIKPIQVLRYRPMNSPLEACRPFATPADFYRLGLRRGECSSVAIRSATQSAVHELADASTDQPLDLIDRQLGQLATSAYRLLDPRYRRQLYERIQLSYAFDRDDEIRPILENNALLTVPDIRVEFEEFVEVTEVAQVDSSSAESIERAREIVRWIRHDEESHDRRPKWAGKMLVSLKAWLHRRAS